MFFTFTTAVGSVPLPAKKVGPPAKESLPISATDPALVPSSVVPFNATGLQLAEPLPPVKLAGEGRTVGWSHPELLFCMTQFGSGSPSVPITSRPSTRCSPQTIKPGWQLGGGHADCESAQIKLRPGTGGQDT